MASPLSRVNEPASAAYLDLLKRCVTRLAFPDARWDWDWMSSWGVLSGEFDIESQINLAVQAAAHAGR